MNIEVIVFDLYNTLIEIKQKRNLFTKLFRKCQLQIELPFEEYINLILTREIEGLTKELPHPFFEEYTFLLPELEEEMNSIILFPETKSVIENLASKYKLYLISNLASPYKQPFFDLNLSNWFEEAIFSCDYGIRKPNREIFKYVEEFSGKSRKQILMVGDSLNSDIRGAKQLGWNYLRVDRKTLNRKTWEIKSLREIEKQLKQI